jgi:hypothetical protein
LLGKSFFNQTRPSPSAWFNSACSKAGSSASTMTLFLCFVQKNRANEKHAQKFPFILVSKEKHTPSVSKYKMF